MGESPERPLRKQRVLHVATYAYRTGEDRTSHAETREGDVLLYLTHRNGILDLLPSYSTLPTDPRWWLVVQ